MLRNICFSFLLLIGGILQVSGQSYYVYATAESEDEVAVVKFDGTKAETIQRIPVGSIPTEIEGPHGISVSPDKKYWYLSMAHGIPYGKVYKFTTGDNKIVGTTELGLFPATMQISTATGLMYVVNFNLHGKMVPSSVSVVDPETMTELTKITTGAMPHGSRISPDGMHHYSVAMMSGELFEIDAANLEVSRTLLLDEDKGGMDHNMASMDHSKMDHSKMDHSAMGHGDSGEKPMFHSKVKPTWVIPHPTNNKLYVAGNGIAEVLEVDRAEWKITNRFSTGKGPYNVEISPNGKLMVVTYKSEGKTGIWNLETGKELASIPNSKKVSHGIAITPDSKFAFVTAEGVGAQPGSVDIMDLEKLERVATAEIGKQAGGIYFWKMEEENFDDKYAKDVKSLDAIIEALYGVISGEKGVKRDWDRFRYLFAEGALLTPSGKNKEGVVGFRSFSPDDYAKNSGPYLEKNGFFETETHRVTEEYGSLVHIFSTYDSRHTAADKDPFARGINSIQLMNDGKRWWIMSIYWLAETPDNPLPSKYLSK